jgi:hypothetical protein
MEEISGRKFDVLVTTKLLIWLEYQMQYNLLNRAIIWSCEFISITW